MSRSLFNTFAQAFIMECEKKQLDFWQLQLSTTQIGTEKIRERELTTIKPPVLYY